MTPLKRPDGKRTPAPYKTRKKGVKKDKYVKLSLTPDEALALEGLAKDWRCSVASTVRITIGMSIVLPEFFHQFPEWKKTALGKSLSPDQIAELEYRMLALRRFMNYWSAIEPATIVDK